MSRLRLTLACFIIAAACLAQPGDEVPMLYRIPDEYAKIHQEGEIALLEKRYKAALVSFKKVLKKFPDFPPALRSAGACHELMGEFEDAAKYYSATLKHNPNFSRAMYFECGNIYYKCGKYHLALEYFQTFDSLKTLDFKLFTYNGMEERGVEKDYYDKLPGHLRACHVALDSIQYWNIPSVTNLGSAINSGSDEYFPFLSNDGSTLFFTSRKNERTDENLLISTRPNGDWRIAEQVAPFNSSENEGMTSLVRDGRRMFFTACGRPQVLGTCDIWEADLVGSEVGEQKTAIGYLNSGAWESQASVSCDGSLLYFASNREGGEGGSDLWVSRRQTDGRWGEPENLGKSINTTGDEEAPFISNDGKVLYFSSTGYLGLGEQDIFMTRQDANGQWSFPVNLGMPVNSSYRELGFFLSADGRTGYFASNRPNGYGGMDIYHFQLPEQLFSEPITYVEGFVKDSITLLPISATVHFANRPSVKTDKDGRFFLCIRANDTLEVEVRESDYHAYRNHYFIPAWDNKTFFKLDLLLDPLFRLPVYSGDLPTASNAPMPVSTMTTELRHAILFEFDKADLKTEMISRLDEFLTTALSGKPVRNVEIIGFADDLGKDAYNLVLSEKRAKAVGVYLKEKGIRVDKIYIEGKGETKNNKARWENRKVEVVINLEK